MRRIFTSSLEQINFVVPRAKTKATLRKMRPVPCLFILAATLSGCVGSFTEPERLYPVETEVAAVRAFNDADLWTKYAAASDKESFRNEIITSRMYAIDLEYTKYEAALTHEGQGVDFGTKLTTLGLTAASGVIPAGQTSQALANAATAVTGLDSAYNDKVLRNQLIQNTQAAMRIARHDQAAIIFANMQCPVKLYPLGRALTDLETYYRAGTFSSGVLKLSQTVLKAESEAKAGQDSQAPAGPPAPKTELKGSAATIKAKADAPTGCSGVQQAGPLTFKRK